MNRLIVQMQSSLDGFVDTSLDGVRWQLWDWGPDCPWSPDLVGYFNEVVAGVSGLVVSRPLLEGGYLDHWQRMADVKQGDDAFAFASRVTSLPKFLLAGKTPERTWPRTTAHVGDLVRGVARAKEAARGDLLCFGGAGLVNGLLRADLIDELQLFVNPGIAGRGTRIFDETMVGRGWRAVDATPHECGVIVCRWRATNVQV